MKSVSDHDTIFNCSVATDLLTDQLPTGKSGRNKSAEEDTGQIVSPHSINWLIFVTETECVYCTVLTGSLYIILRSAHTVYLCVLCGSDNKQRLFPYTTLTDWFLKSKGATEFLSVIQITLSLLIFFDWADQHSDNKVSSSSGNNSKVHTNIC
jgi:hypothetical protein